jgi:hypothetical protein
MMSGIQSKISRHFRNLESVTYINQSIETEPEMIQMIELIEKDTRIVICTVLHVLKKLEKDCSC